MLQRDQWLIMPDRAEAASSTCVGTFPLTSPSRLSIDHRRLTRGTPTPSPSSISNCSSSTCPKLPSATIFPVHNHNPLRIPRNKIQPMLHHNNRQPQFSPQVVRSTHNLLSSMRIEKGRWLIKNDNARLHSQNPGQGHSLLLATRELVRSQFLQRGSARDLHRHINPLPNLVPAESEILRTERDVLLDRQSE